MEKIKLNENNVSCTTKEQFTTTEITMTNYLEEWEFLNPKNPFIPQFFVMSEAQGDFKDTRFDLVLKIVSQAFRLSKDQKEIE